MIIIKEFDYILEHFLKKDITFNKIKNKFIEEIKDQKTNI